MFKKDIDPLSDKFLGDNLDKLPWVYSDDSGSALETCELSQVPLMIQSLFMTFKKEVKIGDRTYWIRYGSQLCRTTEKKPDDPYGKVLYFIDNIPKTLKQINKENGIEV